MSGREQRLLGRIVLVTGASSGIGESVAVTAGSEGAVVIAAARRLQRLERVVERIVGDGGRALALELDVADDESIARAMELVRTAHGRLDALVNCAGVISAGRLGEGDWQHWQTSIDTTFVGLVLVTQAALPLLIPSTCGHIVNISSTAARRPNAGSSAYAAAKAGVNVFTEQLRRELGPSGIRVTLVAPGLVGTELFEHLPDEATKERFRQRFRTLTPLQPSDIAAAIVDALAQPALVSISELVIEPATP